MTVTPSTIVDVTGNNISPEAHEVFSCLRSLDLSMPKVEDGSVEENYEWLHSVCFPAMRKLCIHSYCEWWCERANFLMNSLRGDVEHLVLDVFHAYFMLYCTS